MKKFDIVYWTSALVFLFICALKVFSNTQSQLDFSVYYYAAKAAQLGLNPYSLQDLSQVSHRNWPFAYSYLPVVLWVFRPFAIFELGTAKIIFFLSKAVCLLGLFQVWRKTFLQNHTLDFLFYFLCFFAFKSTIYIDIFQGNVSIFEQLLIWTAFGFYLNRRFALFSVFIIAASVFKVVPAAFLLLLLLTDHPKRRTYFLVSCGCLILFILGSNFIEPHFFGLFCQNVFSNAFELGDMNPSTVAALRGLLGYFSRQSHVSAVTWFLSIAYGTMVSCILTVSWKYLKKLRLQHGYSRETTEVLVVLICLVYALVVPRLKDYSCILLIIPAYRAFKEARKIDVCVLLVLVVALSGGTALLPVRGIAMWLFEYQSLLLAYGAWLLLITSQNIPHAGWSGEGSEKSNGR